MPAPKPAAPAGKLFVKSYGCQMNVYDAQRMAELLGRTDGGGPGLDETQVVEEADVVVLNTCHIRERAAEKIFSELGKLRLLKQARAQEGRTTKIVVAGCVAQAEGGEILRRQSAVDLVVGPQSYHRLPDLLAEVGKGRRVVDTDFPVEDKFDVLGHRPAARVRAQGPAAFVTVQEGCDKFCTFCVVPYTRGVEVSRPVDKIVAEVEELAAAGVREVSLLGQNVNGYHGENAQGRPVSLARLCERIAAVEGIERIRYTTSHPNDMDDELIAAHRDLPALMPFLHLPVQSGSDRILAAMNRKHDRARYFAIVETLRAARPDIALSSDFITGFPGETEADFDATLDLVRQVGFASAYSFNYSRRPGTPGADMADQVPDAVKLDRLHRLQALLDEQRRAFNQAMIGREIVVLIEKNGRHPGQVAGKSPYMQPVQVEGPAALIGHLARVTITGVGSNSLFGSLLPQPHGVPC